MWAEKAEFDALYNTRLVPEAAKLIEISKGDDLTAVKAQVEVLNKVCTDCHTKFRYEQDE